MGTGLCKDCFLTLEWQCPICLRDMLLNARGIHLHHSHGLSLADLN
jgi:hypothetical protein